MSRCTNGETRSVRVAVARMKKKKVAVQESYIRRERGAVLRVLRCESCRFIAPRAGYSSWSSFPALYLAQNWNKKFSEAASAIGGKS